MKLKFFLLFLLFFCLKLYSQVVYENYDAEVNTYLDYFANKGLTNFYSNITPLTKIHIYNSLKEIKSKDQELNPVEKNLLLFFQDDFALESALTNNVREKRKSIFNKDFSNRFRVFSYSDSLFKISLSPILGYEFGNYKNNSLSHRWNGLQFYGYIGDNIAFKFYFRDNREEGKYFPILDSNYNHNTKVILSKHENDFIEYSDLRGAISYSWDWGNITSGKDAIEWGYGHSSKLVLSSNAPSFPFIRLDVYPVDWISFNYFHGWLKSDLIDSTRTTAQKEIFREKYIASHSISIKPFKNFEFSLGESIIYSDKLEVAYLNPLLFFRLADHYLANASNISGGNAQFFFSFDLRNVLFDSRFYGNFYIDDITLSQIFDKDKRVFKNGFSIGYQKSGLFSLVTLFGVEYTRISPFVYEHNMPDQDYKSAGNILGHWIGHNADLIEFYLIYNPIWNLHISLQGSYLRQGNKEDFSNIQSSDQPDFLFGFRKNHLKYGFEVAYTFMHEFKCKAKLYFTENNEQVSDQNIIKESFKEFSFAIYYGL